MSDLIRFHSLPSPGVDSMTASTARSFPRHMHDQYGIGIVDSGAHVSMSAQGQVEAGPGSFICVNPGEVHDGRAVDHRSRTWRIFYFDPVVMDDYRSDIFEKAQSHFAFVAPVFADELLRRLFDEAFAFTTATLEPYVEMACETALLRLVARLCKHSTSGAKVNQRQTACIRRVRARIDADPAAHLTLVELAKEVRLSRYQLLRGFARDLGITPHAYILQRRLALARRLIRTARPLAEVAQEAGFCDQSHLTRCFAKQFGVTPNRYASRSR